MTISDAERAENLQAIEEAYRKFLGIIDNIPEDQLLAPNTVGKWSGKDVVADVAGWEIEVTRYIRELDAGREAIPQPAEEDGTWDQFNQSNVDPTRDWSLDEVKAHFDKVHYEFMDVATASEHTHWPSVVRITKGHYEEHYDDILGIPEVLTAS